MRDNELRARVDGLRSRFLLAPYVWNDDSIGAGLTPIRWEHVRQLRNALIETSVAAGALMPVYTDPTPTIVKAVHFDELRNAVHNIEEK